MVSILNVFGLLFSVMALASCATASTVMHTSNGLLMWIAAAIFFVGAGIIDELRQARKPATTSKQLLGPGDIDPKKRKRWFS